MNGEGGSNFCIHYLNVWLWMKKSYCNPCDMWKLADEKERLPVLRKSHVCSYGVFEVSVSLPSSQTMAEAHSSSPGQQMCVCTCHLYQQLGQRCRAASGKGRRAGEGSVLALPRGWEEGLSGELTAEGSSGSGFWSKVSFHSWCPPLLCKLVLGTTMRVRADSRSIPMAASKFCPLVSM